MKRILYCDLIAYGGIHSEFNSACLQVLMLAYPDIQNVEFFAEKRHSEICSIRLKKYQNIKYNNYRLNSERFIGGFKTPLRDLISCFYLLRIFLQSRNNDLIFIALAYPIAQNFILVLQSIFKRNVYLCQHGELEVFVNSSHFYKNKFYYSLIRRTLKSKLIKTVVLGAPIFKNVSYLFNSNSNVIVIDHPYDFSCENVITHNDDFYPLTIGQIGTGGLGKGTNYLFELAFLLEKEIRKGIVKIKLIGALPYNLRYLDNGLVEYSDIRLDICAFEEGIKSLHYTLQLRDNETGKAAASGSFFDTIKYNKPFLSFYNDYILYYVNKYSSVGHFCLSLKDMADKVKEIVYTDRDDLKNEYYKSLIEIDNLKKTISLNEIARSFRCQDLKLKLWSRKY